MNNAFLAQRTNTYFAVLIIVIVGAGAVFTITRVADKVYNIQSVYPADFPAS